MTRFRALCMLYASNALLMAVSSLTYPVIPLYIVGRGLGVALAGFVTAASSLVSLVSQVLWGYVSDAIGRRHVVMLLGSVSMVLFSVLGLMLAGNIYGVVVSFILLGFGGSAIGVSSYALVADLNPGELGKPMGWYWASASFGWAFPLLFAGFLLRCYGIISIYVVVLVVSLALLAISTSLSFLLTPSNSLAVGGRRSFSAKPLLNVLSNARFLVVYISSLLFMVGDVVKNIYVPQYYAYVAGLGEETATTTLSLASWFEIPAIIAISRLLQHGNTIYIYAFSLAAMSLYLYINTFVESYAGAAVAMAMYSMVWASYIISTSVLIVEVVDADSRGTALGLNSSSFALASIVSNAILGPTVEILGYTQLFKTLSAILFITCLTTLTTLRSLLKRQDVKRLKA